MKLNVLFSVAAFALATSSTAFAQDTAAGAANGVTQGAKSLSFSIPSGGNGYANGAAGLWMVMSPNLNVGFNVGLAFGTKPETNYDLLLAPALRYYMVTDGVILPYYFGQLNLRLHSDGNDATDEDPELGLAGGLGVEWFVTKVFSVSGYVGAGLDLLRQGGGDAGIKFGTLTSGLTGQLYF